MLLPLSHRFGGHDYQMSALGFVAEHPLGPSKVVDCE
jgi:hypothetical protein